MLSIGYAVNFTKPKNEAFNHGSGLLKLLLETGQLFATKEDAEASLEVMKEVRR